MQQEVVKLIHAIRQAIERGDMFVMRNWGDSSVISRYADIIGVELGVFDGNILLRLVPPRMATTINGPVQIVAYHNGVYYNARKYRFREKDIAWIEDKPLP